MANTITKKGRLTRCQGTRPNRFQGITKEMSKKSCGYWRRKEALTKSSDLFEPMIKRILSSGIS